MAVKKANIGQCVADKIASLVSLSTKRDKALAMSVWSKVGAKVQAAGLFSLKGGVVMRTYSGRSIAGVMYKRLW